jgi:hypothetical protein
MCYSTPGVLDDKIGIVALIINVDTYIYVCLHTCTFKVVTVSTADHCAYSKL